jgi:hypothetical protein
MFTVVVHSTCDRRLVDICLTLVTSKPMITNHLRCTTQELRMEDTVSQPLQVSGIWEVIALELRIGA